MALVCCDLIGYISRCPTKMERQILGIRKRCLYNGSYHCIRDEKNGLVETCNEAKLIPKGISYNIKQMKYNFPSNDIGY